MADVGDEHFVFGLEEVVVLDIARHVGIRLRAQGVLDERGATTAANRNGFHHFVHISMIANHLQRHFFFHIQKKILGRHGLG